MHLALDSLEELPPAEARSRIERLAEWAERAGSLKVNRALRDALEVLAEQGPLGAVGPLGYTLAESDWA